MVARRRLLALGALVVVSGCSLVTSLDGLSGGSGPGAGVDAGASDGATTVDAGKDGAASDGATTVDAGKDAADAASDAGIVNLHPNGTFETSTDPWGGFQGTITPDDTEHSGARSLRVCTGATTTDYFTADDSGPLVPKLGVTYRADAWVRTAPGAPSPASVRLFMRTSNTTGGFAGVESAYADSTTLDGTWQRITLTMKTTKPAEHLGVFIGADHIAGACFLLDDVVLGVVAN